ncbi:unnamed protein product, partial [Ectocarpus sp. 12 AP-2014]
WRKRTRREQRSRVGAARASNPRAPRAWRTRQPPKTRRRKKTRRKPRKTMTRKTWKRMAVNRETLKRKRVESSRTRSLGSMRRWRRRSSYSLSSSAWAIGFMGRSSVAARATATKSGTLSSRITSR